MAREFTNNMKQPTRSQEHRSTDPMFILLFFHGRQTSEWMHPKKAVAVKRASSVEGVMGYTRGRGRALFQRMSLTYYLYQISPHPFRRRIWRTMIGGGGGGQKGCLVMFVSKMHRRAPGLYRALDGRTMISLKSMNASPIILVNQSASSRTSMQMCARKYMESSGVPG
jgi:hypothetical protein